MYNIFEGEREWFIFTNYLHLLRYDKQVYDIHDFHVWYDLETISLRNCIHQHWVKKAAV
jgi:hypothetical protein